MTAVIQISFMAVVATLIAEGYSHLFGATTEHLNERFMDYEIISPSVVDEIGRFLSHDIKNAMLFSRNSMDLKRKKRSLNTKKHKRLELNTELANSSPFGNAVDVRNDMQYFNESKTNEFDIEKTKRRYSRRLTAHLPKPYLETNVVHFNVSVFGSNLHLRLESKQRLIAPGAKSVFFTEDGQEEKEIKPECVYSGKIRHRPGSSVALSNCNGLAGFIQTDVDEFFIEPIEIQTSTEVPQRHVIYRRSSELSNLVGKRMEKSNAIKRDLRKQDLSLENSIEDFLHQHRANSGRTRRHSKRGGFNMEILLIADSEVVGFHGREHVVNYLVTLINIVDEIYHDSSLGEQHINIVLARVYQLDPVRSNRLIVEEDAPTSLKNVCKWSHNIQRSDPSPHGRAYDNSVFVTRRRIGPAGYANVDGMCETLRSCSLTHEDGFSSAFVVAHEIGHVLGVGHDGEGNACGDEASMGSIMAPLVQAAFNRYHWSRCSRQELKSYTVKGKYSCLNDNPHSPDWGPTPLYPGISYSLDDQCRFDFGQGYKACTAFREVNFCKKLWCSHDDNPLYCKTKKGPPVDGTECDENMWCFKGHCVWRDQRHSAISGQWGEWGTFEECSRSCGSGVRYRTRLCNNPMPSRGGSDCIGQYVDYSLCNKRPCPSGHDFRADQCSYRNSEIVFKRQKHKWFPYEHHDSNLKCELYCVSKKTGDIVSMSDIVADGTRCSYENPHGICIRGECVDVGCDKVLGSSAREDICGVCNGNGTTCIKVVKNVTREISKRVNNYMKLFVIPKGARQIKIYEISEYNNSNVFALKSRNDRVYFLNAKSRRISERMTPYKTVRVGTLWNYDSISKIESISAYGPTNSDTIVMILIQKRGVRFSYHASYITTPRSNTRLRTKVQYKYVVKKTGNCSAACGNGYKKVKYGCKRKGSSVWSNWKLCSGKRSRTERKKCRVICKTTTSWEVHDWNECSVSCGLSGIQTRQVVCHQTNSYGRSEIVSDAACSATKPAVQQICKSLPCPTKWRKGAWSQCSASCGDGFQRRQVICRPAGRSRTRSHAACSGPKPIERQQCRIRDCHGFANQCVSDRSIFCKMEKINFHCALPGYKMFCCKSCKDFVPDNSANQVPGQSSYEQSLTVAILSHKSNVTNYDDNRNHYISEHASNYANNETFYAQEMPETEMTTETPILNIASFVPSDDLIIDDAVYSNNEDEVGEMVDGDLSGQNDTIGNINVENDDQDLFDEGYESDNYKEGGMYDSANEDIPHFNDDSRTGGDLLIDHEQSFGNDTRSISNVDTGFKTTKFEHQRNRREVASRNIDMRRDWANCDLILICGMGKRKALFGFWNKFQNKWTNLSFSVFPKQHGTCVSICFLRQRPDLKQWKDRFFSRYRRAKILVEKDGIIPSYSCQNLFSISRKYSTFKNYEDKMIIFENTNGT